MRYNEWFVAETQKYRDMALSELTLLENDLHALELKRERLLSRRNELEFILAEIRNRREALIRTQKHTCWAMSGECV